MNEVEIVIDSLSSQGDVLYELEDYLRKRNESRSTSDRTVEYTASEHSDPGLSVLRDCINYLEGKQAFEDC